jgi:hypothetical protein
MSDKKSNLNVQSSLLYHLEAKPIAHLSLARLNKNQPTELFKALFSKLYTNCQRLEQDHRFRFKNSLTL